MASGALFALVIVGGLALVIAVAVLGHLAAKRRREAFAALAARHGWAYTARDDGWTTRFEGSPFGHGFDRQATNVLTGAYDGRPCVAFDYRYSTESTSTDSNGHTTHAHRAPSLLGRGDRHGRGVPAPSGPPRGFRRPARGPAHQP